MLDEDGATLGTETFTYQRSNTAFISSIVTADGEAVTRLKAEGMINTFDTRSTIYYYWRGGLAICINVISINVGAMLWQSHLIFMSKRMSSVDKAYHQFNNNNYNNNNKSYLSRNYFVVLIHLPDIDRWLMCYCKEICSCSDNPCSNF